VGVRTAPGPAVAVPSSRRPKTAPKRLRAYIYLRRRNFGLEGILNYCRTKVPLSVVEAVNGNIKTLLRRGRGYKNLRYLLLKAQRMAAARTEIVVSRKAA